MGVATASTSVCDVGVSISTNGPCLKECNLIPPTECLSPFTWVFGVLDRSTVPSALKKISPVS